MSTLLEEPAPHSSKTASPPKSAIARCKQLAERILEIANGGLSRRNLLNAQGKDERVHLELLTSLVQSGKTPADAITEGLNADSTPSVTDIIARAHL